MATTPPPPKRIRIPPTPLHGPQIDTFEPYSPRRSTRIAKLHNGLSSPNRSWNSASSSSAAINSVRSLSGTFSPPQSPVSPVRRTKMAMGGRNDAPTPSRQRRLDVDDRESESDASVPVPQPNRAARVTQLGAGMLPTPSKTPKKRVVAHEAVQSTSGVLFPGRLARLEDAMPPSRRSKKNRIFSLDGLDEDGDDEAGNIPIYTDSKDRVPDVDDTEDNPFVTKTALGRGSAAQPVVRRSRRKGSGYEEEIEEMERKVRNDEGMIYVFRGRKVFRRFDDKSEDADASSPKSNGAAHSINEFIKRKAGAAAGERFTRSSITPRLLFPNAEQQREREERARREEEEAITDIEVREDEVTGDEDTVLPLADAAEEPAGETPQASATAQRRAKVSPFASWQRMKAGARPATKGTKREREAEVPDASGSGSGKRVRSGTAK